MVHTENLGPRPGSTSAASVGPFDQATTDPCTYRTMKREVGRTSQTVEMIKCPWGLAWITWASMRMVRISAPSKRGTTMRLVRQNSALRPRRSNRSVLKSRIHDRPDVRVSEPHTGMRSRNWPFQ